MFAHGVLVQLARDVFSALLAVMHVTHVVVILWTTRDDEGQQWQKEKQRSFSSIFLAYSALEFPVVSSVENILHGMGVLWCAPSLCPSSLYHFSHCINHL